MADWIGSPNYSSGRQGNRVELIVVHHMNGTLAATDSVFQNTTRDTSAHYGVGRDGRVHQYVNENDTAYHAGNWNINLKSVGIEHEDLASDDYTDTLYATSAALIRDIASRWGIPINADTVRPHRDFTATACPGTLDIARLISEANGGNDMIEKENIDEVRIINSEVEGYDFAQTHNGKFDATEMGAWTGKPWTQFIDQKWKQGEAFRAKRSAAIDYYDNKRPGVEKNLATAQSQIDTLKAELGKAKNVDPNSIVITSKGWQALWDAAKTFFNTNK